MGLLMSCASWQEKWEDPKIALQEVNVEKAGLTEATLVFQFLVENPNSKTIKVDKVDYALSVRGKSLTQGVLEKGLEVGAKSSLMVPLPVRVKYSDVFESLASLLKDEMLPYQMEGKVKMGLFSIPFKKQGEVKLRE